MIQPYRADLKMLARNLRANQTEAEQRLWQALRRGQLGAPFYRQKPLLDYIVDFYCPAAKLVVELDGSQHQDALEQDQQRDLALQALGLKVLRFDDRQALLETEAVLTVIWHEVSKRVVQNQIPPSPPLRKGGEGALLEELSPATSLPLLPKEERPTWLMNHSQQPASPPLRKGEEGALFEELSPATSLPLLPKEGRPTWLVSHPQQPASPPLRKGGEANLVDESSPTAIIPLVEKAAALVSGGGVSRTATVPPFAKGGLGGISSQHSLPPAIFLMGPTASGKTASAIHLLESGLPVELISVDSALVFRDMDIGTAKPDAETLARAPHHLIDIISPEEAYSAAQFRVDALRLMADITARGKVPVLVGGTMLYFNTLQHGIHDLPQADPVLREKLVAEAGEIGWPAMHAKLAELDPLTAARLKPNDAQRIERALEVCLLAGKPMSTLLAEPACDPLPYNLLKIALLPSDRAVLHARIALRFDQMLAGGLLDEVKALRAKYQLHIDMTSMRCVGYRQTWEYLDGLVDWQTMREKGLAATRQLAKRQLTWLRGMDDVVEVDCLAPDLPAQLRERVVAFLAD